MPPSLADLNSVKNHGYEMGLVCCHNGKMYVYYAKQNISYHFYWRMVEKYIKLGYDEFSFRWETLKECERQGTIFVKEVQ